MLNMQCIYVFTRKNQQNLTWQKKDQYRTKTDRSTVFLELIIGKKGFTEQSSDFTIIRKIVVSSQTVAKNDILHVLA